MAGLFGSKQIYRVGASQEWLGSLFRTAPRSRLEGGGAKARLLPLNNSMVQSGEIVERDERRCSLTRITPAAICNHTFGPSDYRFLLK